MRLILWMVIIGLASCGNTSSKNKSTLPVADDVVKSTVNSHEISSSDQAVISTQDQIDVKITRTGSSEPEINTHNADFNQDIEVEQNPNKGTSVVPVIPHESASQYKSEAKLPSNDLDSIHEKKEDTEEEEGNTIKKNSGHIASQTVEEVVIQQEVDLFGPWDILLRTHVSSNGLVDYTGLVQAKNQLEAYLNLLSENPPTQEWSKNKKLAYWINVYNAFTIKLIVDNYPINSIMELDNGKPWDKKWIKIGGDIYSLNNIENDIIRPGFNDARIHFAVNCAAKSCPPLWNRAWTPSNLESSLEARARLFINDPSHNRLGASLEISKIFDWYAVDFGNIISYINKYTSVKMDAGTTVNYMEYDWSLNE